MYMRSVKTRIAAVDTAEYNVYRVSSSSSVRVGTKNVYTLHGTITAQLSAVRDALSLERYGDRVDKMYTLTASKGADIQKNDKIQLGDGYYKVISTKLYTGHVIADIERVEVL